MDWLDIHMLRVLSMTEEPAKPGKCARDRRALQQLALNVHVKHSDLTSISATHRRSKTLRRLWTRNSEGRSNQCCFLGSFCLGAPWTLGAPGPGPPCPPARYAPGATIKSIPHNIPYLFYTIPFVLYNRPSRAFCRVPFNFTISIHVLVVNRL